MGEEGLPEVCLKRLQDFLDSGKANSKFLWVLQLEHFLTLYGMEVLWPGLYLVSLQINKDSILAKLEAYPRDADLYRSDLEGQQKCQACRLHYK